MAHTDSYTSSNTMYAISSTPESFQVSTKDDVPGVIEEFSCNSVDSSQGYFHCFVLLQRFSLFYVRNRHIDDQSVFSQKVGKEIESEVSQSVSA